METILGLGAVFLLVFINGFFVAAEFAFVGARRTRIAQLAATGSASARAADRAIHHLDSYIAATQLGITLASLALGWIGEPAIAHLFEPLLSVLLPEQMVETVGRTISVILAFAIVTVLHIVLGELTPKAIALQRPEPTALVVARPITWFLMIFRPVIGAMNWIGNRVVRALGFKPSGEHAQVHSAEELEMLVHSSTEAGLLQASEEQLLRRVFEFSDIRIESIMRPRVDVDGIPADITLPELLDRIRSQKHSRFPVYEGELDRVIGVLHTMDVIELVVSGEADQSAPFDVRSVMRPPLFVPETVGLDRALEHIRRTRSHLIIVVDEYGGMAGIVTLQDIVEQIVGDVEDEFDEAATTDAEDAAAGILDGATPMAEIEARFAAPSAPYESVTIGGYVSEVLDRIPTVGDSIALGPYRVRVEKMDSMRVDTVRFSRNDS